METCYVKDRILRRDIEGLDINSEDQYFDSVACCVVIAVGEY